MTISYTTMKNIYGLE